MANTDQFQAQFEKALKVWLAAAPADRRPAAFDVLERGAVLWGAGGTEVVSRLLEVVSGNHADLVTAACEHADVPAVRRAAEAGFACFDQRAAGSEQLDGALRRTDAVCNVADFACVLVGGAGPDAVDLSTRVGGLLLELEDLIAYLYTRPDVLSRRWVVLKRPDGSVPTWMEEARGFVAVAAAGRKAARATPHRPDETEKQERVTMSRLEPAPARGVVPPVAPAFALPVLPANVPLRLSPTDVTRFVRLDQCERFLRFQLSERAGHDFMRSYQVQAQRLAPILSLSGSTFEAEVAAALGEQGRCVDYAAVHGRSSNRANNHSEVVAEVRGLKPGASVNLFQVRLDVALDGWLLRGDVDLIRATRAPGGDIELLITDTKSTVQAKVEHRLQVAFYRLMLGSVLTAAGLAHEPIQTAILFRPPPAPEPEELELIARLGAAAKRVFGLDGYLLEVVADPDAYDQSVRDLVLGPASTARRVAGTPFDDLPFDLSVKCDGCLYTEFCMKRSAETEDLSLLPYLSGTEKQALRRVGVGTIRELAALKDFAPDGAGATTTDLIPVPVHEPVVKRLAATWPVGPRLDELVHRAKQFRRSVKKDGTPALPFIPGRGNSTLPVSRPDLNPNLVWVYIDAQHDYVEGRVYLLGALVVACEHGVPVRRKAVVEMTAGPPDSAAKERDLFVAWTRGLLNAVLEVAAPSDPLQEKTSAPIHLVFFDRREQRLLLDGLARTFPAVVSSTPPLYDFVTQLAAFDSPIASYAAEEVRAFQNFPMTCQSLQSLAAYLKFDWNAPHPFRDLFRTRVFDQVGQMDVNGQPVWYTRRARFGSTVPLEYAYAAWGQLPAPGGHDEFADYRGATAPLLTAFQTRRLEALEHVTCSVRGNPNTSKTPFVLPDVGAFADAAHDLAHALGEFVTIERLVGLSDWKATRHAPPEQRVLMGECLLVRYLECDQDPGAAEQNRENERRRLKREAFVAAHRATQPDKRFRASKQQQGECKWSPEGLRLRLRLETAGVDCDLHEALLLTTLREGDRLVVFPRLTADERLPEGQRGEFTPTPKQMLYGQRCELLRLVATKKDGAGRVVEAFAEVELKESRGSDHTRPYVFASFTRPLDDGRVYTLDPCPNEWYAYWCAQVVAGLCAGQPNALYDRLLNPPLAGDGSGSVGQRAFLAGLDAFRDAGLLHDFEPGKRDFIGGHARTPLLLVQGPPGTGKSYSTAFAVLARLQGAMRDGRSCRAFLSCKTHAATDVLLANVVAVRTKLRELRAANPKLFAEHFDARLLDVPLYRVASNGPAPLGAAALARDADRGPDEQCNADIILGHEWVVAAVTPGGTYGLLKKKWPRGVFGHALCDLLVLDEASQMNLPEALMAALPLAPDGPVVVVGDHRQMPPIVKHDWDTEVRRTFRRYAVYESLFDTLRAQAPAPPVIRFEESFRLHKAMAAFLCREVYRHDGINYHSKRSGVLPAHPLADDFVAAVLNPEYPLVVVVHDECDSQVRNPFEQELIAPLLQALTDPAKFGLDATEGLGVVVPHRAQRAALQQAFPELTVLDPNTGLPSRSAVDTVERFQGGERTAVLVSATESDRGYLLASAGFLLDPRRLTVAVSRAKRKMILVASRSVFELFSPDEDTFGNALLWKNLLHRTCGDELWEGVRGEASVQVWGGRG